MPFFKNSKNVNASHSTFNDIDGNQYNAQNPAPEHSIHGVTPSVLVAPHLPSAPRIPSSSLHADVAGSPPQDAPESIREVISSAFKQSHVFSPASNTQMPVVPNNSFSTTPNAFSPVLLQFGPAVNVNDRDSQSTSNTNDNYSPSQADLAD